MSELHQLNENLDFVRSAVSRARMDVGSPAIYFLWAVIVGIGFSLPLFAPEFASAFWMVAVVGGGAISIWLGQRHARARGVVDRELGRRQGQHWLASSIAMGSVVAGVFAGRLEWAATLPLLISLAGLAYVLAGVHLHPPLRWVGAIFLAASVALWWVPGPYVGVLTGAAVAFALGVGGLVALRSMRKD
jgi:hypothetical protein